MGRNFAMIGVATVLVLVAYIPHTVARPTEQVEAAASMNARVVAVVPGACCGPAMTRVVLELQRVGLYKGLELVETSKERTIFAVRYDPNTEAQAIIEQLVAEVGGEILEKFEGAGSSVEADQVRPPGSKGE